MLCPSCKKSDTRVIDSRDEEIQVKRRRCCLKCNYRFSTYETFESPKLRVIKKDGNIEQFCSEKLARGVNLALEKRPFNNDQIQDIIHQIEQQVIDLKMNPVPSKEIGNIVLEMLRKKDDVAYLRFLSVYKKFGSAKKFQKEAEKLSTPTDLSH